MKILLISSIKESDMKKKENEFMATYLEGEGVATVCFLIFLETKMVYSLGKWISLRKSMLNISTLVRSLIETLRWMVYNWKFSDTKSDDK